MSVKSLGQAEGFHPVWEAPMAGGNGGGDSVTRRDDFIRQNLASRCLPYLKMPPLSEKRSIQGDIPNLSDLHSFLQAERTLITLSPM